MVALCDDRKKVQGGLGLVSLSQPDREERRGQSAKDTEGIRESKLRKGDKETRRRQLEEEPRRESSTI